MSTWFSHLSRDPNLFGIDLTNTLENDSIYDENGELQYSFCTDNYSAEFLYPTFARVLKDLSVKFENLQNVEDNHENILEHFDSACLSYITPDSINRTGLFFIKNEKEIDSFPNINKNNEFHIIVETQEDKDSIIDLYFKAYLVWLYHSWQENLKYLINYVPENKSFMTKEEFLENKNFNSIIKKEKVNLEKYLEKLIIPNPILFKEYFE